MNTIVAEITFQDWRYLVPAASKAGHPPRPRAALGSRALCARVAKAARTMRTGPPHGVNAKLRQRGSDAPR